MKNILSASIFLILTSTLSSQDLFKQNEAKNYEINLSTGLNYISYIGEAFLTRGLEVIPFLF